MNKENSWKECLETNSSVRISPDKAKAQSLVDTATGRNEFLNDNKIKERNANYIFEAYYSSALEIMHAIVLLQGYKVTNHICLGYYLYEVLERENLYRLFDDCRYKRNSLIYYGRKMDFETAKDAIKKCKILIKELKEIFEKAASSK